MRAGINKGVTLNLVPYADGWGVFESWRPETLRFFDSQDAAMAYAQAKTAGRETPILIHPHPPQEVEPLALLKAVIE